MEGRKKARLRYIPVTRLSEELKNTVEEHMSSFVHLYFLAAAKQRDKVKHLAKNFFAALKESCNLYDRYRVWIRWWDYFYRKKYLGKFLITYLRMPKMNFS